MEGLRTGSEVGLHCLLAELELVELELVELEQVELELVELEQLRVLEHLLG